MNLLAICLFCWLIPLGIGLLCALLGYLLGRYLAKGNNNDIDINVWKNKVAQLEADLEACNQSKIGLQNDLTAASFAATSATLIPFNADAAKVVFGKKIKQDDLKIVEGIGPKIEGLFHDFGIKTWKSLGETSVEKCQEVLDSGGERYRIHKPDTWPQQAQLAYEGKWEELKKWQDELDGGKA